MATGHLFLSSGQMIFSENRAVNPEKMIHIQSFFLVFPNVPKDFRDFKVTYILQNHWTRDRRARDAYKPSRYIIQYAEGLPVSYVSYKEAEGNIGFQPRECPFCVQ